MSGNDLAFVRQTMQLLHDHGIATWLFGGWAEELLGLIPPRASRLDLLYAAGDFAAVDALLAVSRELIDIPAKRLPHKRTFLRLGIMTELILIRPAPGPAWITDFWDQAHCRWPDDILATQAAGLRVASAAAVRNYRAHHDYIHATSTHPRAATELIRRPEIPADQTTE